MARKSKIHDRLAEKLAARDERRRKKQEKEAPARAASEAQKADASSSSQSDTAATAPAALTDEQQAALDALMAGKNVFLTGEAGTGKSFVLDRFIRWCHAEKREVLAMAPTGIAALNLPGGTTIHRTLGIPPAFCDPNEPIGLPRKVLRQAEIIIIDEISMCRIDLFERVVRMIVAAQAASGPKQVVLVGDFFQLPPVVTNRDLEAMMAFYPGNPEGYCFKSNFWTGLALEAHVLTQVHRTAESDYLAALNQARRGDATCIDFFNKRAISKREQAPDDALWLCVRNAAADSINESRLSKLKGKTLESRAGISGTLGNGDKPTSDVLYFKIGARVMSVVNDRSTERAYLNGSLGTIVGFKEEGVVVKFDNGNTALIEPFKWTVNKAVVGDAEDPETGEKVKRITLEEIGCFVQIPLRLAWAMTIHKAQGQTLTCPVAVETHVFTSGQLYVGISRSTRAADLTIYPKMEAKDLHVRRDVQEFYDTISGGAYALSSTVEEEPAEVVPIEEEPYTPPTLSEVIEELWNRCGKDAYDSPDEFAEDYDIDAIAAEAQAAWKDIDTEQLLAICERHMR